MQRIGPEKSKLPFDQADPALTPAARKERSYKYLKLQGFIFSILQKDMRHPKNINKLPLDYGLNR